MNRPRLKSLVEAMVAEAVKYGKEDIVSELMKRFQNTQRRKSALYSAAMGAAQAGRLDILQNCADELKNLDPTDWSADFSNMGHYPIFFMFDVTRDAIYASLVVFGIRNGNIRVVEHAVQLGINVNTSVEGYTFSGRSEVYLVDMAVALGYIDIVRLLLDQGANFTEDPLAFAARAGWIQIANLLLDRGFDPTMYVDRHALTEAVWCSQPEMVRLLLTRGSDWKKGRA